MTKLISPAIVLMILFVAACGGGNPPAESNDPPSSLNQTVDDYDPSRGEGKFTELDLGTGLNPTMAESGEKISASKCQSCHKLTDERLVGPGWAGVTTRRTPVWLMNFITNPDPMIDKDPELQAQLELCLVRMPNQNLSDDDARHIVEFMRKNDGVK